MLEGYTIAKKITIDGKNLSIFFRDNQSPPVFVFSDILTITFRDYGRKVTNFIDKISDEHKEKIFYNHCERWVLDFEGMAEFVRAFSEDAENILDQIKDFVDNVYKGDLPSPVVVIKSSVDNKIISVDGISYEYKISNGTRWFKIDPFIETYGNKIKRNLKLLDTRDIRNDWVSEEGLMDVLQVFETDKALETYEGITEACNLNEIIEKPWRTDDLAPISLVIDGDKSDSTRYLFKTKEIRSRQLTVVYTILDSGVVLLFYDIKLLATLLDIDPETAARAAINHCSCFFKGNNVYTNIVGVNSILQRFSYNKDAAHALTRKACKAFYGTKDTVPLKLEGKLVYTTRDVVEVQEVKHSMKPVPISDGEFAAVDVAQVSINDASIIIVFAKRTTEMFNPSAEIIPMFGISTVGSAFGINNATMLVKSLPPEERGKVSLPELKKSGVIIVTESGLKTFLRNAKEPEEAANILNTITAAVIKYLRENKETINFTLSYWEKKEIFTGIPIRGEKKTIPYFHDRKPVDILLTKQDDKEIPYISVDSLNKLPNVQISSGNYVDQDGNRYVSVADWVNFVTKNEDSKLSKEDVDKLILLQLSADKSSEEPTPEKKKDVAPKQQVSIADIITLDTKAFVLSAVTLAENLRGMITYYKARKIKTERLPGPSTASIINDLWKYIQCQELNSSIPLGFEKVVQTGIHRLDHLLKTAESRKG